MPGFLDSDLGKILALQYALGGFKTKKSKSEKDKEANLAKENADRIKAESDERKKFFADKNKEFDAQDKRTNAVIERARKLIGKANE